MAKQQKPNSAVNVSFNLPTGNEIPLNAKGERKRYSVLHGMVGEVLDHELTALTRLAPPFTYQAMMDCTQFQSHGHLLKAVAYLARYNDPSDEESGVAGENVGAMLTALHGVYKSREEKCRNRRNLGLADKEAKKVGIIEAILMGEYVWERVTQSTVVDTQAVATFDSGSVNALRAKLLAKRNKAKAPETKAPETKAPETPASEQKAETSANNEKLAIALEIEVSGMKASLPYVTAKKQKRELEAQIAAKEAKIAELKG
jgi:hypothetical protein